MISSKNIIYFKAHVKLKRTNFLKISNSDGWLLKHSQTAG